VQRLTICDRDIKVLTQPKGFVTEYFAIGMSGDQLPLACVDHGILGDFRFPRLKLL
jgi:hypothetical protein